MNNNAKELKELANRCGKQIFDEAVRIRKDLLKKGLDDEVVSTVLMDGAVTMLASIFSYNAAPDGGEKEQTEIVRNIHGKIFDLLRDEHVRHGGQVLKISLEEKS